MAFSLKTPVYQLLIDPLLSPLRLSMLEHISPSHRVIDIACGTGMLALAIGERAAQVTAIDLDAASIAAARKSAAKQCAGNVFFEVRDASDLSCYRDREFDVAVTSMAIHQFEARLAVRILSEMQRIAGTVVVADYSHHMPRGWGRRVAWILEWIAGGDHYRNFRAYMQHGGMRWFAKEAGLKVVSEEIRGGGVFVVAKCEMGRD
jgi:2-polyprenyl-3-methyl-5-hydroxy-6-metoxy-1,4-benzoquinol methylase